jgi:hypothetical protein
MLRVTVEIVPHGDERRKKTEIIFNIINNKTGDQEGEKANYDLEVIRPELKKSKLMTPENIAKLEQPMVNFITDYDRVKGPLELTKKVIAKWQKERK